MKPHIILQFSNAEMRLLQWTISCSIVSLVWNKIETLYSFTGRQYWFSIWESVILISETLPKSRRETKFFNWHFFYWIVPVRNKSEFKMEMRQKSIGLDFALRISFVSQKQILILLFLSGYSNWPRQKNQHCCRYGNRIGWLVFVSIQNRLTA